MGSCQFTASARLRSELRRIAEGEGLAEDFVKDDGLAEVVSGKASGKLDARGMPETSPQGGPGLFGHGPFEFVSHVSDLGDWRGDA